MNTNQLRRMASDGVPLYELKLCLVVYAEHSISPRQARAVYDLYLDLCGDRIAWYRSTSRGASQKTWDITAKEHFEHNKLPTLRQRQDWGYVFSDGLKVDSSLFMLHGYRPHSEAGRASFYRFEFSHQTDPGLLRTLAQGIVDQVPFLSGLGGYTWQARIHPQYQAQSYDALYELAQRYRCVEVQNLDVTVGYLQDHYKSVNWLTLLGENLQSQSLANVEVAQEAAFEHHQGTHGLVLQIEEAPKLGDVRLAEDLTSYQAVANALLPFQIRSHPSFGGTLWTDQNTLEWIRRYTLSS